MSLQRQKLNPICASLKPKKNLRTPQQRHQELLSSQPQCSGRACPDPRLWRFWLSGAGWSYDCLHCLHCSPRVSIFSSLPLICLLICASDLSARNRFSLCSPSGNLEWGWPNLARAEQSPESWSHVFWCCLWKRHTHTRTQTAQNLRRMKKKKEKKATWWFPTLCVFLEQM